MFGPKKDKNLRFYVDYRRLNAVSVHDCYPIPRLDENIDSIEKAKLFFTLNADEECWQSETDEKDVDKTAFVTHNGLCKYSKMVSD